MEAGLLREASACVCSGMEQLELNQLSEFAYQQSSLIAPVP
jgi:hypothetical protein